MKLKYGLPSRLMCYFLLILFAFLMGFPVIWMIFSSLKTQNEIYTNIWGPPRKPQWANYHKAWVAADVGTLFRNSTVVSLSSVFLITTFAALASFSIAKIRFRGSQTLFLLFIITMLVPQQILVIPLFRMMRVFKIINTHFALILPYTAGGLPLAIFIFTTYFRGIEDEILDAARIDGCGYLRILSRIILPISLPALSAVVIFEFLENWNEFFLALIFIQKSGLRTLPLGVFTFSTRFITNYSHLFGVLSLSMMPVVIIFLIFQRYFISGLTRGALVE